MCSGSGPLGAGIRSPVPHPSSVHGPSPLRLPGDHSDTKAITTRGWSRAQAVTGDRGVARTHLRAPERSSSWRVPWMPERASRRPVLTVGSRRDGLSQNVRSSGPGTSVAALDAGVGRGGRPRLHGGGSRVPAFLPSAPPPRWGPSREGRGCPDGRGGPGLFPQQNSVFLRDRCSRASGPAGLGACLLTLPGRMWAPLTLRPRSPSGVSEGCRVRLGQLWAVTGPTGQPRWLRG